MKRILVALVLLLAACILALASTVESVSTAHSFDPSGSDSNPGTQPAPWLTLIKAAASSVPTVPFTMTASSTPMPVMQPRSLSGIWTPSFDEEFNGTALDTTKWTVCYPWDCHKGGNGELTVYSPVHLYFGNGVADIRAVNQRTCDRLYCTNYGSSLIQSGVPKGGTTPKFTFEYGYIEGRMQVPHATGYFPAFWLLGKTAEIDLMEVFGNVTTFSCGVHLAHRTSKWSCGPHGNNMPGSWHTFAVDWQPDHMTFYYDGQVVGATTDPTRIPHEAMYILLDFAVGANFIAPPDLTTIFPADFLVDYVRVWQPILPAPTPFSAPTTL